MDKQLSHARVGFGGEIRTAVVDIVEWDGEFVVMADFPGFDEEDLEPP